MKQRWRLVIRAAVSLLLGGAAVFGAMLVFRQGLLPLIDAAFRPGPDGLSAIRRAGIVLSVLAGYGAYVRWHEKRKPTELRPRPIPVLLGAAGGAALAGLPIAALFAFGVYEAVVFRGVSSALSGVAVLIGIAALLEEIVYRCLLLQALERALGTGIALVVQAIVFAAAHLENVEKGGVADAVTMLVSVTLLGMLWGGIFVLTRNVWVAAAHHAAWNFTILLSGVPLSGIDEWRALAPLDSRYAGSDRWTGGIFGPENSLLVVAVVAVAVVALLRAARRRGAGLAPTE